MSDIQISTHGGAGGTALTDSASLRSALSDETGTGLSVFNTSPTLVTPLLGTPTSGTLTNCTLPIGGVTGLGTNVATFLATPSSANLLAAVTGATGTGAAVFGTSPTFTTGLTAPVVTITQGTITADAPLLDMTVTRNGAGIVGPAIKLNVTDTSSNAAALLADLGVGGGSYVSKWKLDKTGVTTQAGIINSGSFMIAGSGGSFGYVSSNAASNGLWLTSLSGTGSGDVIVRTLGNDWLGFGSGSGMFWTNGSAYGGSVDIRFFREAAGSLAQRSGAQAQRFGIFNTYTSSTNNEGLTADWQATANLARIYTFKGSGGGTARGMALGTDSTNRITIDALGNVAMNGENAAMATTATDGYLSIPTCAGAPTGVPTAKTGAVQLHYDITNDKLWVYNGGWKSPKTPAAAAVITWQ